MVIGEVTTVSGDSYKFGRVTGAVINIKSKLDNVKQTVHNAPSLASETQAELEKLVSELEEALKPVAEARPEDADRVADMTAMVVKEATRQQPNKSILNVSLEGLKEAANAVAAIAPAVIGVATKIANVVAGMP
jgi:tRNA C32,U32 (ribose-2'-O)-methylase TrmJ